MWESCNSLNFFFAIFFFIAIFINFFILVWWMLLISKNSRLRFQFMIVFNFFIFIDLCFKNIFWCIFTSILIIIDLSTFQCFRLSLLFYLFSSFWFGTLFIFLLCLNNWWMWNINCFSSIFFNFRISHAIII